MLLKEFRNVSGAPATSIAAAGSTTSDATVLAAGATFQEVTAADGTKGVKLAAASDAGDSVIIYSSAATNACKVYPPGGGQINEAGADTAHSLTARKPALYKCLDATSGAQRWVAILSA